MSRRGRDLFSRLRRYVIPGLRNQDQPSSRSAQHPVPTVRSPLRHVALIEQTITLVESRLGEIGADIIPMNSDPDTLITRIKITSRLVRNNGNEIIDVTSRDVGSASPRPSHEKLNTARLYPCGYDLPGPKRKDGKCHDCDLRGHRHGRTSELQETPGEILRRRCVTRSLRYVSPGGPERSAVFAATAASVRRRRRRGGRQRQRRRWRRSRARQARSFSRLLIVRPRDPEGTAATQAYLALWNFKFTLHD